MNFSGKLILAGLAVSLISLPACERHGAHPGPGGKGGGEHGVAGGCGGMHCGQGPGAGHKYGRMDRTFEVYIYTYTDPDGSKKCAADVDVSTLWKEGQNGHPSQMVTWFSDDGNAYIVDFRKGKQKISPFLNDSNNFFPVPASGSVSSGKLDPHKTSGYYEFAILPGTDSNANPCKDASDPGYYVKP